MLFTDAVKGNNAALIEPSKKLDPKSKIERFISKLKSKKVSESETACHNRS